MYIGGSTKSRDLPSTANAFEFITFGTIPFATVGELNVNLEFIPGPRLLPVTYTSKIATAGIAL